MTNKVLISRHDKIGDFIVTLPMFKVLKTQRPELILYALVSKVNFELASQTPYIDHVILFEPNNLQQTLASIRSANIDTSISAFIDTKLAWLLYRCGIKQRIAPATKIAQVLFNQRITQRRSSGKKTEFEYNLDLLLAFDPSLQLNYSQPLIDFDIDESLNIIESFRREHGLKKEHKLIAFHPGSGGSAAGNLSVDDYLILAKSIAHLPAIKVVFTFGPDDQALREQLSQKLDFSAILYNSTGSLRNFCILASYFDVFVSTSPGTMHLTAASNTCTLSFFGENIASSPQRWASINEANQQNNIVLANNYTREQFLEIKQRLFSLLD